MNYDNNNTVSQRRTQPFQASRKAQGKNNAPVSKALVKQMIRSTLHSVDEEKYYSTSSNVSVDFSGTVFNLFSPTTGVNDTNRIGDKVVYDKGEFKYAVGAADATNLIRVIIFKWLLTTTPSPSDILNTGYLGTVTAPLATLNWDNRSHMKVYYDQTHYAVLSSSSALQGNVFDYIPKGEVNFLAGGATASGLIYCLAVSDSGAAPNPAFEYGSLISFTDS
jgi:hypothetical protein